MALDLGSLVGRLELDGSAFDATLGQLPGKLEGSSKVLKVGAGLAAAGIGLALAGGINTALDLQDVQANLSAQLGLSTTESERIGGIAGSLYTSAYGDSIEGVSDAVGDVVSSIQGMRGASDEAVEGMTAKVLDFNTVFGVETARTTQIVGQMLRTGLVADADEAMDLLTVAMQRVPTAVREDVLDAMDEYGPFFAQLGLSGEEAMGALVNGAEQGMYGIDKTGDALKELTIRATDMSKTSELAYNAAGLDAEEMAAKFLAGGEQGAEGLTQLVDGLLGIKDPTEQANAAIGLFGTPLEDLGTDKIPQFLDSLSQAGDGMGDVAGAADKMGEAVNGTARVGWTEIQRQFEAILGQVGAQLLPVLGELTGWLLDNPGVITALAVGVGVLAVAFIALTVATWAMNTALLANPVTWVVIGIVALIAALALLIANWDSVVSWISGVWGGFVGWLTDSLDGLGSWWSGVWEGMLDGLSGIWDSIIGFVTGALSGLLDLFFTFHPLGIIIANWGAIVGWFAGLPSAILGAITTGWTAVTDWLTALPAAIGGFLADAGSWLLATGYDLLVGLLVGILVAQVRIGEWFLALPGVIGGWLASAGTWLVTNGIALLDGLRNGIVTGYQAVVAFWLALPGRIVGFLASAASLLIARGTELLRGLMGGITTGYQAVVAFWLALPGRVQGFLASAGSWLVSHGRNLLAGLQSGIVNGYTAVSSWFSALPGRVVGYLASAGSWLTTQGASIMRGLSSGISSGWSTVSAFLGSIPGKVRQALANAGTWLLSAGGNIIDGLVAGIRGALGRVTSVVGDIAADVKGRFASALGINSPSRVFRGFGLNIGEGLLLGLAAIQPRISSSVQGLVSVPEIPGMSIGPDGTFYGGSGAPAGPLVDASVTIQGNVGWDADEIARRTAENMSRALSLSGIDDIVGVA